MLVLAADKNVENYYTLVLANNGKKVRQKRKTLVHHLFDYISALRLYAREMIRTCSVAREPRPVRSGGCTLCARKSLPRSSAPFAHIHRFISIIDTVFSATFFNHLW